MLLNHADHEPHKISKIQIVCDTRRRASYMATAEQTDGSATRDREVVLAETDRCESQNPVSLACSVSSFYF